MSLIPESFIDELLTRVDLHDLIGRYIVLKKVGSRFMGVCPFHGDKTPSLSVSPDRGLWYCFGCHEGGNAISFIKKKENLDFADAVRFIAGLYNIPVPQLASDAAAIQRRTLYDLNTKASEIYIKILFSKHGRHFREYLLQRGFKKRTVLAYRVGGSLNSWEFLSKQLLKEGFSQELIIQAGLGLPTRTGGICDRFRNRLMIPIIDTLDRTLGFGARAIGTDSPKYINTSETPIFEKSKILFGLNLARTACRDSGRLIIMEGYTDVMHAHQAGILESCAVMGTALTKNHIPILNRYVPSGEVVLSFDGDEAGRRATMKSIVELGDVNFTLKVLELPQGADPADIIVSEGAESFRQRVAHARPASEWLFQSAAAPVAESDLKVKLRTFRDLAPYILEHRSSTIRDELLDKASIAFNVYRPALQAVLDEVARGGKPRIDSGSTGTLETILWSTREAERIFFLSLLANPIHFAETKNLVEPEDFYDPLHRKLASIMFQASSLPENLESLIRMPAIYEDDELRGYVAGLSQEILEEQEGAPPACRFTEHELKRSIAKLLKRRYDEESKRILSELAELNKEGSIENEELWGKQIELLQEKEILDKNFREICSRLGANEIR